MARLSTKFALCTCLAVACGGKASDGTSTNGANGATETPGISDGTGPGATTPNDQVDPGAWNVALVTSLTGADAALGQAVYDGAALAVEQINAAGGVKGKRVKLVVKDDASSPSASRAAVLDLAQKGVHVGVGPATSRAAAAWIDLVRARQLVYVSPSATSAALDPPDLAQRTADAPSNDLLFRTQLRLPALGTAAAQYLSETAPSTSTRRCNAVALVHPAGEDPATSLVGRVENRYEALALRTLDVPVSDTSTAGLRAAASQVLTAAPAVPCQLVTLPAPQAGAYAAVFAEAGGTSSPDFVSVAAGPETTTSAFFAAARDAPTSTAPTHAAGWTLVRPLLAPSKPLDAFTAAWAARHPEQPAPDFVHAAAYDAAMLAVAGLVRSNGAADTAPTSAALVAFTKGRELLLSSRVVDLVAAMQGDGDVDYAGPSGSVDIGADGYTHDDVEIARADDAGRLTRITTYAASTIAE